MSGNTSLTGLIRMLGFLGWSVFPLGATATQTLVYRTGHVRFSYTVNEGFETAAATILKQAGRLLPPLAGLEARLDGQVAIELGCGSPGPSFWRLNDGPEITLDCEDGNPETALEKIIASLGLRNARKASMRFVTIQLASFPDGPGTAPELVRWRERLGDLDQEEGVFISGDLVQVALWYEPAARGYARILFGFFPDRTSAEAFLHRNGLPSGRFLFPSRCIRLDRLGWYFGEAR